MSKIKKKRKAKTGTASGAAAPERSFPLRQMRAQFDGLVGQGEIESAGELLFAAIKTLIGNNNELALRVRKLEAQLAPRRSSEKISEKQLQLMLDELGLQPTENETEQADLDAEAKTDKALEEEIAAAQARDNSPQSEAPGEDTAGGAQPAASRPKRRRRKAMRADLERRVTVLPIPEEQKDWELIGHKETERLRFSPASFYIEVLRQPVLRAPQVDADTGADVLTAVPVPPALVPGAMAGNDVIAMLLLRKFEELMPAHRLHRQFQREQGVDLPVSTLCDWIEAGGTALARLQPLLLERARKAFLVQIDGTSLRVLDAERPGGTHRGTIMAYIGVDEGSDTEAIAFVYTPSGDGESGPWKVLAGRQGYVLADAHNLHDRLFNGKVANAIEVGCNAHARRKLVELKDDPRVAYPLLLVRRLFRIERLANARRLSATERTALRQERSRPTVDKLRQYLLWQIRDGTPTDPMVKAANYYINHWDALTRFIDDGRLPLDNSLTERQFRIVRVGERNYLFAGSDDAAERMAAIMSVLATAKAHDINLWDYLCDILDRLSYPLTQAEVEELLPHRWKARRDALAAAPSQDAADAG
jgi:transposase